MTRIVLLALLATGCTVGNTSEERPAGEVIDAAAATVDAMPVDDAMPGADAMPADDAMPAEPDAMPAAR